MTKKTKTFSILFLILTVFSILTLISLTKFPTVFGDEVEIANMAYELVNPSAFSDTVFSSQLPPPGGYFGISYPPLYFWILAISLKLFGFSIYTLRATSFFIGFMTLISLFVLLKKLLNSDKLALLAVFLMAIDYSFIRASRFGQTHILAASFFAFTILYYIKTFKDPQNKNFLLAGLFSGFCFLSHLIVGFIAPFLTIAHYIITARFRKIGFKKLALLMLFPVIFFILFFAFKIAPFFINNPDAFNHAVSHYTDNKLSTHGAFHFISVLEGFTLHVAYEKAIFYIYLIMFFFLLFVYKNKTGIKSFFIFSYLFMYPYIIAMHSHFYAVFFTVIACFAFIFILKEKVKLKPLIVALFVIVVISNLLSQGRIIKKHHKHSYAKHSEAIASNLPKNSKVLLLRLDPEPYFYLAQHRKDLRLERGQFMDIENARLKSSLKDANLIVVNKYIYKNYIKINKKKDYSKYKKLDARDKLLVDHLVKHTKSFILLDNIDRVIFRVN